MIRADRDYTCERKKRYPSHMEAQDMARLRSSTYSNLRDGIHITVYGCTFCSGWHLTKHSQLTTHKNERPISEAPA